MSDASSHESLTPGPDPVLAKILSSSTRLMAGRVTRSRMKELQKLVDRSADSYPWEAVVDEILREEVGDDELSRDALKAQRDWVVRGGREAPGKSLGRRSKGLLAWLIAQLIIGGIFMLVFLALALVLHLKWDLDIYQLLVPLQEWFPALKGG